MLNHCFGLFVTSDALDLAGRDLTDHGPHTLGNSGLKHLVKLRYIHAKVVHIVAFHVDVEDYRDVNLHENVVTSRAGGDWLIENDVLLGNQILSLCPRETPVLTRLPDTQVLAILCNACNYSFRAKRSDY